MSYSWSTERFDPNLVWYKFVVHDIEGISTYSSVLPNGIYELNDGSRSEQYSITEFTASRTYICDWNMRYSYIEVLRESVYSPDFYTYFTAPRDGGDYDVFMNHSYFNYFLPARVQSISVGVLGPEGVSYDTGTIKDHADKVIFEARQSQKFTTAKITVNYKGLALPSSATIDQTVTPQLQMRKLPPYGCYWLSDGSLVLDKESPAVQEIKLKIQRTLSNVREVPPVFFDLAGCVNNNVVVDDLTGLTFAAGTLLYMPTNMQKRMTSAMGDDDALWNFGFELNWNPIGWNRFVRPHGVDSMMRNGVPIRLYPYADFDLLGLSEQVAAVDEDSVSEGRISPFTAMYGSYRVILQEAGGEICLWRVRGDGSVIMDGIILGPPKEEMFPPTHI